jgi:hypothetical protein
MTDDLITLAAEKDTTPENLAKLIEDQAWFEQVFTEPGQDTGGNNAQTPAILL